MRRVFGSAPRSAGVLAGLALLLASAAVAQEVPGERPPRSIREAYERAEQFGQPPAEEAAREAEEARSLWLDPVHYLGVAAGALALGALGVGLYIFLVVAFRRGPDRVLVRRAWRLRHVILGLSAVALAVAHSGLRAVQTGEVPFSWSPPQAVTLAFVLLALSGVLRMWPPRSLARYTRVWVWSHRVLLIAALLLLVRHVAFQYARFAAPPG